MAMSKTGKTIIIIIGVFFVFFLVAIIGLALLMESAGRPSIANNSVLVLNVSGDLPDYSYEDPTARLLGFRQSQSFTSLLTQLRKAKVDNRISAVLLDVGFPQIGWGKADELRDAIIDLKQSGKPVYAYMEIGANKEYYIASAADKVFLPPTGDLYINGFAANVMFYRGTLDKIGVEPEFIQIGPKYKNAPDQYTKKEMGEGQREVMNSILDSYYDRYANAIAEARKKTPEDVKALIDDAPFNAVKARDLGLIDGALYREQVDEELKKQLGYQAENKLRSISTSEYREIRADEVGLNNGEKVAVIYASGPIVGGRSSDGTFGGSQTTGSDTVVQAINDAAADDSVKAIILRVDSPGGSALASDLMWHAIENAKAKKKPVVVSMSDYAASGGYYISCNADKIVAEPNTLTGSIGMFTGKMNVKGLYTWLGISNEYILRGKNAGLFRETEKWNESERAKMIESARTVYNDNFLPKVAKGRNKTVEEIDAIGQGHVWTGTQGKERGLVDEIGGMEKAIEIAKNLAGLPADKDVRRVVFPAPRPFLETLFDSDSGGEAKARQQQDALINAMPKEMQRALRFASVFDRMNRGEAIMMLPFDLEIK
jgi:protease IV